MKTLQDIREGFFDNVGTTNAANTLKIINNLIQNEVEMMNSDDELSLSEFAEDDVIYNIPNGEIKYNETKQTLIIASKLFNKIKYEVKITDFIEKILNNPDPPTEKSVITISFRINEDTNNLSINIKYAAGNSKTYDVRNIYRIPLIKSPFTLLKSFLKVADNFMISKGSGGRKKVYNRVWSINDIKSRLKEILDLM